MPRSLKGFGNHLMTVPHVLIVGVGSAGRRHAKNLTTLGTMVSCMDPRSDHLAQAQAEVPSIMGVYESFERAVSEAERFAGVVIASPPSFHVEQTLAFVEQRVPVLLEKPIAPDLASAQRLEDAVKVHGTPVLLGYTYRWWPPLIELRQRLKQRVVGPLRSVRFIMSAHLADWHPWERYQDFFMASRDLGGGALLDESHFIDLMVWCLGMPEALVGRVEHLSELEMTSDDHVDCWAIYPQNLRVSMHLDLYGRPHEKSITIVGERGTLQCLFDPHVLRYSTDASGAWQVTTFPCERNDMFLAEAREFLSLLAKQPRQALTCTIEDGLQVLRCVEAIRLSTRQEKTIWLSERCCKVSVS